MACSDRNIRTKYDDDKHHLALRTWSSELFKNERVKCPDQLRTRSESNKLACHNRKSQNNRIIMLLVNRINF